MGHQGVTWTGKAKDRESWRTLQGTSFCSGRTQPRVEWKLSDIVGNLRICKCYFFQWSVVVLAIKLSTSAITNVATVAIFIIAVAPAIATAAAAAVLPLLVKQFFLFLSSANDNNGSRWSR